MKIFVLMITLIASIANADIVQKDCSGCLSQAYIIKLDVTEDRQNLSLKLCNKESDICESLGPFDEYSYQEVREKLGKGISIKKTAIGAMSGYTATAISAFTICATVTVGSGALACFGFIVPFSSTFAVINGAGAAAGAALFNLASRPERKAANKYFEDVEVKDIFHSAEKIHKNLYDIFSPRQEAKLLTIP